MVYQPRIGRTLRSHLRPRKGKISVWESESKLGLESNSGSPPGSLLVPAGGTASMVMSRP